MSVSAVFGRVVIGSGVPSSVGAWSSLTVSRLSGVILALGAYAAIWTLYVTRVAVISAVVIVLLIAVLFRI